MLFLLRLRSTYYDIGEEEKEPKSICNIKASNSFALMWLCIALAFFFLIIYASFRLKWTSSGNWGCSTANNVTASWGLYGHLWALIIRLFTAQHVFFVFKRSRLAFSENGLGYSSLTCRMTHIQICSGCGLKVKLFLLDRRGKIKILEMFSSALWWSLCARRMSQYMKSNFIVILCFIWLTKDFVNPTNIMQI